MESGTQSGVGSLQAVGQLGADEGHLKLLGGLLWMGTCSGFRGKRS